MVRGMVYILHYLQSLPKGEGIAGIVRRYPEQEHENRQENRHRVGELNPALVGTQICCWVCLIPSGRRITTGIGGQGHSESTLTLAVFSPSP